MGFKTLVRCGAVTALAGLGMAAVPAGAVTEVHTIDLSACTIIVEGSTPVFGTNGDDVICGDDSRNIIYALGGNDIVLGFGGNDLIFMGNGTSVPGRDIASFTTENGQFGAQLGYDLAIGGAGNDLIYGGNGDDLLFSTGGDRNELWGQNGNDQLSSDFVVHAAEYLNHHEVDEAPFGARMIGGNGHDRCDGLPPSTFASCEFSLNTFD